MLAQPRVEEFLYDETDQGKADRGCRDTQSWRDDPPYPRAGKECAGCLRKLQDRALALDRRIAEAEKTRGSFGKDSRAGGSHKLGQAKRQHAG